MVPEFVDLRVWRLTLVTGDLVKDAEVGDVLLRVKVHVEHFKKLLDERVIISVRSRDLLK